MPQKVDLLDSYNPWHDKTRSIRSTSNDKWETKLPINTKMWADCVLDGI